MRSPVLAAVVSAAVALAGAPAVASPAAPVPDRTPSDASSPSRAAAPVRHLVRDGDDTYVLRLSRVALRGPGFGVFVQRADGGLRRVEVGASRGFLGQVRGRPRALAAAARGRDGVLRGQITVDGRRTLFFTGRTVDETRGTSTPDYHWPSADDAERNVTVRPGQLPRITRRWDIGYDLDHSYLDGELGGSVARAMDQVDLTTVRLIASYETNARLRPAIGRVVLRTRAAAGPYPGTTTPELTAVRDQWTAALDRGRVDAAAYLHSRSGGGVAYVGTIGSNYAVSLNGGGNSIAVIRHELAHNWGPSDNHTNGPEGATIVSGNDHARFDGTELAAILAERDSRLESEPRRFPRVARSAVQMPPYATLDLRDGVRSGRTVRLSPVANDLDGNGDRVTLHAVPARSELGARLVRRGDRVVYTAPRVDSRTLDWFEYTVADGRGGRATGVVLLRVRP